MNLEATSVGRARVSLLVMFLYLVLAIAFLALVGVQTATPLPDARIPIGFFLSGMPV